MAKVVITQEIPKIAKEMLEKAGHSVEVLSKNGPPSPNKLRIKAKKADAIITLISDKIDASFFKNVGKNLKIIANYAIGFDNIDTKSAQKHNIFVTNTPGDLAESVAEHTIALMFAVAKKIAQADRYTRSGKWKYWDPMAFIGESLWGKTIGIVGLGRIGSFTAEICYYGLKMNILYTDIKRDTRFEMELKAKHCELHTLVKNSDIISLNVPLLPLTHHLIGAHEFDLMKKNAILINTSRGPVIDEDSLIKALQINKIAGAGLDVYEKEPKIDKRFKKLNNVVLTPHSASATVLARDSMAKIAAQNVIDALAGRTPPNVAK